MKLYLVRHGEAAAYGSDQTRPLSEKGRDDIKKLAAFIASKAIGVEHFYHSEKQRALETAEILSTSISCPEPMMPRAELDPLAPVTDIAAEINQSEGDIVLVGHMPFLGALTGLLVAGDQHADAVMIMPGTMICLERQSARKWIIRWMLIPELFQN